MTVAAVTPERRLWYYGWNIVAACIVAEIAGSGLSINVLSLFVRDWSADFNVPISDIQLALFPLATLTALSGPVVGWLADKQPARILIGAGLLGIALFHLGVSVSVRFWQFAALYGVLFPFALNFSSTVVCNAVVSRWFVRRNGLALGLTGFGVSIAGIILPPIVAVAMPSLGWRGLWEAGAALIGLVVLPAVFFVLRDRPTAREGLHYVSIGGQVGHGGHGSIGWMEFLRRRNFWLLLAVFLPILAISSATTQNLTPIATSRGLSRESAGALIAVFNTMAVISTLSVGILSDRFGQRRPLIGLALLVSAGVVALAFSPDFITTAGAVAIVGTSNGIVTLLAASLAVEFGAQHVGQAFGLTLLVLPLNAMFPFALAKTQEATGTYTPALLGFALLAALGAFSVLAMREPRGGHLTAEERDAAVEVPVPPLV